MFTEYYTRDFIDNEVSSSKYARMMAARTQTLYGIPDSPVGLATWLLDHNDADDQPEAKRGEASRILSMPPLSGFLYLVLGVSIDLSYLAPSEMSK